MGSLGWAGHGDPTELNEELRILGPGWEEKFLLIWDGTAIEI